jgi:peroxiredoxin
MKKIVVTFLVLVIAGFVAMGFRPVPAGYSVGDTATDFHLKNVDGKIVSLADYKAAKGFIVTFTCNHCPFAKMYESRIMALNQKYAPLGYPVIAINPNDPMKEDEDSYANMVTRAKEKGYTFPYLVDELQDVTHAFGATNTPHLFVLNKEKGALVVRYIGAIDDNAQDASAATKHYTEDAVNQLLANQQVAVSKTKAIGCSIKWKDS